MVSVSCTARTLRAIHFNVSATETAVSSGTLELELVKGLTGAPGTGLRCTIAAGASRCTGTGTTSIVVSDPVVIAVTGTNGNIDHIAFGWSCASPSTVAVPDLFNRVPRLAP